MGKLLFKYATMNSGKTIDLIRTAYNYEENNGKVLVMKPSVDTKGKEYITSRISIKKKVDYLIYYDDSIIDVLKGKLDNVDVILVDEAQFFSKKQIDELSIITRAANVDVICYGLRCNFKNKLFEGSKRLFEVADSLEEFPTLCKCKKVARFVGRKVNGEYSIEGPEVIIDGSDNNVIYTPLCRECYLKEVLKIDLDKVKKDLME